jgi:hypothetical protein
VTLAAGAVAFLGLLDRDMTGDELGTLGLTLLEMLDRSVETHRPDQFSAHVPLAWALRHLFLSIFGDATVLPWRLHAALGHVAGAVATWAVIRAHRTEWTAVGIGLLVALHPIAAYHAHDSTNYSLDALTGALTLGGLAAVATGRPRAGLLLGTGLLLGLANDYYFVFVAIGAAMVTPFLVVAAPDFGRARRASIRAWGATAAVVVPASVLAVWRFRGTPFDDLIARHANSVSEPRGVGETITQAGHWFAVHWFDGYEALTRPTPDLVWIAPLIFGAALLVAVVRGDAVARSAAVLAVVAFGLLLLAELVFPPLTGRQFPAFPRNHLCALPAVALLVGDLLSGSRRVRVFVWVAALLLLGGASLRQGANVTSGRAWAAGEIVERWQPGDRVLSQVPLRFRLSEDLNWTNDWCLEPGSPPPRIWLVTFPGGPVAEDVTRCSGDQPAGPERPLSEGYRVRYLEDREVAPHEGSLTNSYLTFTRLILLDRTPAGPAGRRRRLETGRRLLDGAPGATLVITHGPDYVDPWRGPWRPSLDWEAPAGTDSVQFTVERGDQLLLYTQPRPWIDDPIDTTSSIQMSALGDPRLLRLRRGAAWLLLLAIPLAFRRSGSTGSPPTAAGEQHQARPGAGGA